MEFPSHLFVTPDSSDNYPWQTIVSVISAATALVATIVVPFLARRSVRDQITSASTIAQQQIESAKQVAKDSARLNLRKEWMESLTVDISNFISDGKELIAARKLLTYPSKETIDEKLEPIQGYAGGMMALYHRIRMRLDEGVDSHDELLKTLFAFFPLVKTTELGNPQYDAAPPLNHLETIAISAQRVLSEQRQELLR